MKDTANKLNGEKKMTEIVKYYQELGFTVKADGKDTILRKGLTRMRLSANGDLNVEPLTILDPKDYGKCVGDR